MLQNITVRPESAGDIDAIFQLTEQAFRNHPFGDQTEKFVVNALRRSGALAVSLVAEMAGQIVGHVAFSPAEMSNSSRHWYVLGPVSVLPPWQRQGIGRTLIQAGLEALRARGAEGCVLVGDPAYYSRFGFRHQPDLFFDGIAPEHQKYSQALPLGQRPAAGTVRHHEAFNAKS